MCSAISPLPDPTNPSSTARNATELLHAVVCGLQVTLLAVSGLSPPCRGITGSKIQAIPIPVQDSLQ